MAIFNSCVKVYRRVWISVKQTIQLRPVDPRGDATSQARFSAPRQVREMYAEEISANMGYIVSGQLIIIH